MSRRPAASLVASPVLVGAVTVMVVLVGFIVTYNAAQGLPFTPTYDVSVTVPDAVGVTEARDVRIAGKRVGVVRRVHAQPRPHGAPVAVIELKLDRAVEPIRADTEVLVRPLSPLGAKYLELVPGSRGRPLRGGEALPLGRSQPTVDLTEAFDIFDARTRHSLQVAYANLGDGFAGRGAELNDLLGEAPPLMARLERTARALAGPGSHLPRFVGGAARTASELGATRGELGSLMAGGEVTLGALAGARGELADAIAELPKAEALGARALANARPLFRDAEAFLRDADPGLRVLDVATGELHGALVAGLPVLRRAPGLADSLDGALAAIERLARDPATSRALRKLRSALRSLRPTLRVTAPAQTVCNYVGLAGRNIRSALSEGDSSGAWLRVLSMMAPPDEHQPAAEPAAGLHVNPYAHTGQNGECEAGNERFLPGRQIGNVPGDDGLTEPTSPPGEVGGG